MWLFIGNRIYRRRTATSRASFVSFTCTGCEKMGKSVSASARKTDQEYQLTLVPREETHVCSPNNVSIDIKMATKELYEKVLEETDRSVGEIYRDVRERYTENMEPERREEFLKRFQKFKSVSPGLYTRRGRLRERVKEKERLAEITSHYSPTFAPFFFL